MAIMNRIVRQFPNSVRRSIIRNKGREEDRVDMLNRLRQWNETIHHQSMKSIELVLEIIEDL